MAGTTRALLANMVTASPRATSSKLELVGVGYRAAVQGKKLNLTLGFSHPVELPDPEGHHDRDADARPRSSIKGIDRQKVGQVAAEIRDIRPPEPYKGKGVRYAGEKITLKEAQEEVSHGDHDKKEQRRLRRAVKTRAHIRKLRRGRA